LRRRERGSIRFRLSDGRDAALDALRHQGCAFADPELVKAPAHVLARRVLADAEVVGDRLVALGIGNRVGDLHSLLVSRADIGAAASANASSKSRRSTSTWDACRPQASSAGRLALLIGVRRRAQFAKCGARDTQADPSSFRGSLRCTNSTATEFVWRTVAFTRRLPDAGASSFCDSAILAARLYNRRVRARSRRMCGTERPAGEPTASDSNQDKLEQNKNQSKDFCAKKSTEGRWLIAVARANVGSARE